MPDGSGNLCFEAPAEKQVSLAKFMCEGANPAPGARQGLSDADLVFVLGAALLEAERNGR